jgi:O-acetyl-ADP-ribose deacetylase
MSWKERVIIELGDIAQSTCEAVVNAANSELWMGSGVAGALRKAGGPTIEQEAVRLGPIGVGEAVITKAGHLPTLHVIHAAAMGPGRRATAESVAASTRATFTLAVEHHIDTLAFPALGTGVGGLALHDCAEQMLGATREHLLQAACPREVRFMLYGDNALEMFQQVFAALPD